MSATSATYLLDPEQDQPVQFDFRKCLYHVCPNCARANELRTCNGDLIVTFDLCEKHVDAPSHRGYDQILLDQIRHDIHTVYPPDSFAVNTPPEWIPTLLHTDYTRVTKYDKIETAEPVIVFAHAQGCSRTDTPDVVIISPRATALLDEVATARLGNILAILNSDISTLDRPTLMEERTRLENCLGATNTAKGMYMKRCNGEYRNALDDELIPDPTTPNGYRPSDLGYSVLDLCGPCEKKRWTWNANGWPNPIPTTFTYKKLKYALEQVDEGKTTDADFLLNTWYRTRSGKRSEEWLKKHPDGKAESRG